MMWKFKYLAFLGGLFFTFTSGFAQAKAKYRMRILPADSAKTRQFIQIDVHDQYPITEDYSVLNKDQHQALEHLNKEGAVKYIYEDLGHPFASDVHRVITKKRKKYLRYSVCDSPSLDSKYNWVNTDRMTLTNKVHTVDLGSNHKEFTLYRSPKNIHCYFPFGNRFINFDDSFDRLMREELFQQNTIRASLEILPIAIMFVTFSGVGLVWEGIQAYRLGRKAVSGIKFASSLQKQSKAMKYGKKLRSSHRFARKRRYVAQRSSLRESIQKLHVFGKKLFPKGIDAIDHMIKDGFIVKYWLSNHAVPFAVGFAPAAYVHHRSREPFQKFDEVLYATEFEKISTRYHGDAEDYISLEALRGESNNMSWIIEEDGTFRGSLTINHGSKPRVAHEKLIRRLHRAMEKNHIQIRQPYVIRYDRDDLTKYEECVDLCDNCEDWAYTAAKVEFPTGMHH